MLDGLRNLPLESSAVFEADERNIAAAESYVRRALEALLDLGRHVLAKGFGRAPTEYKEIADGLIDAGVLDKERGRLLREMAGYRNRLVHFYDEVTRPELYQICTQRVRDVETVMEAILSWIRADPSRTDGAV
ncbi:MAG: DUF86 domain-containing protein [Gemmatimonadetes bacterium]|nr:DUF86 domain-containing protein [Gemmatimonadota bacterium]